MGNLNVLLIFLFVAGNLYPVISQLEDCENVTVADIVFLADGSSSIGKSNFEEVKVFMQSFVENLNVGKDKVQIGVAQFTDEPYKEFVLNSHSTKQEILAAIKNLPYRNGKRERKTGLALDFLQSKYFIQSSGSRKSQKVPQIAIVFTDGESSDNVTEAAQALRDKGITIYVIGIKIKHQKELKRVVARPFHKYIFNVDRYEELKNEINQIQGDVCSAARAEILATSTRFSDIVFLVDSSHKMGRTGFRQAKTFIINTISPLKIGPDAFRIGLAQYSENPKVEFLFNEYQTVSEIKSYIDKKFAYTGGSINTGKAINFLSSTFFQASAGSRIEDGYPQYAVVVTSSKSDDNARFATIDLEEKGVKVIVIGGQETEMKEFETPAKRLFFKSSSSGGFDQISENITKVILDPYPGKQIISTVCNQATVADIVFLVDASGSIGERNFQQIRDFLHSIVEAMDVDEKKVRIGMVLYSTKPQVEFYLNSFKNKNDMLQHIEILPYKRGLTYTGMAIDYTKTHVFNKNVGCRAENGIQQIAIIVTDGKSLDDVLVPAANLHSEGVTVYAVGIQDAKITELKNIASHPAEEHVCFVQNFQQLENIKDKMSKQICRSINEVSSVPVKPCEECTEIEEADIYFLISGAGSTEQNNSQEFTEMKTFMSDMVDMFKIGLDKVRVGVVQYSDVQKEEFSIDQCKKKADIQNAISGIRQEGSGTQTGRALDFVHNLFKKAAKNRNQAVSQILIIITDQTSKDSVTRPANVLRSAGIKIYAVGVKQATREELNQIVGEKERIFYVNNTGNLNAIKKYVVQEICYEEACKIMKADVIFLIESSANIKPEYFINMTTLIKSLVNDASIGQDRIQVGLIQFGSQAKVVFQLGQYSIKSEILEKIENLQQLDDGINTGQALKYVSEYFETARGGRPHLHQYLIIVTLHEAQDEFVGPVKDLQKKGINIISVGAASANITQLEQLSGNRLRTFYLGEIEDLSFLTRPILLSMCRTDDTCKETIAADIIFLVDGSNSIDITDYLKVKKFMEYIVNNTEVGEEKVKFGAITYSNNAEVEFDLQKFLTKSQIREAIFKISKENASTYTAKALGYAKTFFDEHHGGRRERNIPQILMVITDGQATDRYCNNSQPCLNLTVEAIRNAGIITYAIGVADPTTDEDVFKQELQIIAGSTERFFYVANFDKLVEIQKKITISLCKKIKQACYLERADIVFLLDVSEHIAAEEFNTTKEFLKETLNSFDTGHDRVRVGLCQYSSTPEKVFYLNEIFDKNKLYERIDHISQAGNVTYTGTALDYVGHFFETSFGGRKTMSIPQILLVITAGRSQDDTANAANKLLNSNINIFSVGVGNANIDELTQIAGQPNKTLYVPNVCDLQKERKRVVRSICTKPCCESRECTIDILVGFDKTTHNLSFTKQKELQEHLPQIIKRASSLSGISCSLGFQPTIKFSFLVLSEGFSKLFNSSFEINYESSLQRLLSYETGERTYLKVGFLNKYFKDLSQRSTAKVKILLLFSDGLNDPVSLLKDTVAAFETKGKNEGIHALFMMPLENAKNVPEIMSLEFGRIFKDGQPRTTKMEEFPEVFLRDIESLAERDCCKVFCKCIGSPGYAGDPGKPGIKGDTGFKGVPGHDGDEGTSGSRGPPGLPGIQGITGCQGNRGLKGGRGYTGAMGPSGEQGLDGISGEEGYSGIPGHPGEKGDPGALGRRGLRGEPGERGNPGIRGDPGTPGQDSRIPGQKGSKGNPGVQGYPGSDGSPAGAGSNGNTGPRGRRGPPGLKGERGSPGGVGSAGDPGPQGKQGEKGVQGSPGVKGIPGRQGIQGDPGSDGVKGNSGRLGHTGLKGEQGEPGEKGEQGLRGIQGSPGLDGKDGFGTTGRKGIKGEIGFPGNSGIQGDDGDPGSSGGRGAKGNRGREGDSGSPGDEGSPGTLGPKGPRGPKGPSGISPMAPCQLVAFVRNNSCTRGIKRCPAFPTELVFALDMSNDVQSQQFQRMKTFVKNILNKTHISENNCPIGTRVAVFSYNSHTNYAIRFSDYNTRVKLMQAVEDLTLKTSSSSRTIGTAMRFVGRNAFKRFRPSIFTRKIAIFFTSGDSTDLPEMNTAVLEYKALDIIPVIVAFKRVPNIRQALKIDDTGTFRVFDLTAENPATALQEILRCTICYDPCDADEECETIPGPLDIDMDLAFMLDSSQNINRGQLKSATDFIGQVIDQLSISSAPQTPTRGARIALIQHSPLRYAPQRGQAAAKQEFSFLNYTTISMMKRHLQNSVHHLQGTAAIGHAIEWTVNNVFNKVQNPRKLKVIFAILNGKTSYWDKEHLREKSLYARCLGYSIFVLAVGKDFSDTELYELSSSPREQHFIHLGAVLEPEIQFAKKFVWAFFNLLKSGMNKYPDPDLLKECKRRPLVTLKEETRESEIEEEEEFAEFLGSPTEEKEETEYEEYQASVSSAPFGDYNNEEAMISQETNAGYGHGYPQYINGTMWHLRDTVNRMVKDRCLLDIQHSNKCKPYEKKWYYDKETGTCNQFWYGGCDENGNQFDSEHECLQTCSESSVLSPHITSIDHAKKKTELKGTCDLDPEAGPCQNYNVMWYYNKNQIQCFRFWYGGCGGNENRFETKEICEHFCASSF